MNNFNLKKETKYNLKDKFKQLIKNKIFFVFLETKNKQSAFNIIC